LSTSQVWPLYEWPLLYNSLLFLGEQVMQIALHPHFTAADDRQTEVNAMMRKYDINGAGGLLGAADMCA